MIPAPSFSTLGRAHVTLAALLLAVVLAPGVALAQDRTEVVRDTQVRLDPDDARTVVGSVSAGTVVDWLGESGDWYRVSRIPGLEEDAIGYIRASDAMSPALYRARERRRAEERSQSAQDSGTGWVYLVLLVGLAVLLAAQADEEDALTHNAWEMLTATGALFGFSQLHGATGFQGSIPQPRVAPHISVSPRDSRISVGVQVAW